MFVRDAIAHQVLITTDPGELIAIAEAKMENAAISALLVYDKKEFVGIVAKADVAHSMFGQFGNKVGDIMTKADKVIFVKTSDTLEYCKELMRQKHIHHLVVKDENSEIVGIISSLDT